MYISLFLPNIWVCVLTESLNNDIIKLKKINQYLEIKEAIKLYQDITYWKKSSQYDITIRKQILEKEIINLIAYYKQKSLLIKKNYFNNIPTIIITKTPELLFGLLIFYNIYISKLQPDDAMRSISTKIKPNLEISMEMKLLFQKYMISQ
jgi:hypothetical protein